ncbi:MAG: Eco57I restriction-modification methylase domain-containing protein [Flavisolibacter sp.]
MEKLDAYREWLLALRICDPACGSGAFLNAALEYLIAEHRTIDELKARVFGDSLVYGDIENSILEKNLYGVDVNEDAVEIAKLSLWLRTAQKGRKLSNLSSHIRCGNSLIDDPALAGEKAFRWEEEFEDVFAKGGFDVVIGNPPYGVKFEGSEIYYFRDNYDVITGHSEAYYLFFERAKLLVKKTGLLGFIIPNAWFTNKYAIEVRRMLLNDFTPLQLVNFNKRIIFEEANVETSIYIGKFSENRSKQCLVGSEVDQLFNYDMGGWMAQKNLLISFSSNQVVNSIFLKVLSESQPLESVLDISNGFKPYQVGYGTNLEGLALDSSDVAKRIYHSSHEVDSSFKKEIKGKGVKRYSLEWDVSYVKWGPWLMSPKDEKYFESPKLLLRQIIADKFFATLDYEKYYADQTLYVLINYQNSENTDLHYYLALLNSKLYGFFFRKFYSADDDLFPKIKVNELKSLPVINIKSTLQQPFVEKSKIMLAKNKELTQVRHRLLRLLQAKHEVRTITKKIFEWPSLSLKQFLKELEKQKIKLSLAEQQEWLAYFEEQKQKAGELQRHIDETDKEIDRMVYALYGLSEDEISVVEENSR